MLILKANFDIQNKLKSIESHIKSGGGGSSGSVDQKIDNISTFLLRMNNKIDSLAK